MARYTVRVELHSADQENYENLHDYMQEEGFRRYITDSRGKRYQLPTAEYDIEIRGDKSVVLRKANKAASKTNKEHMVLVTTSNGRTWNGLPIWKAK